MPRFKAVYAIFFLGFIFLFACKNSDTWLGRTWNNTLAHYNAYFNAEQSWLTTVSGLREGYKDDYRSYIELYNYGDAKSLKANQGTMEGIIKKLSTIIDKHPKSKWVDDCYLLMGKSYFMKGDFFAATDIFDFVNANFKDPLIVYDARLWIFRCLYSQGKMNEAENLAVALKNDAQFPAKLLPDLNQALGAIYLKNNKPTQAAPFLENALGGAKQKLDKYRLHFVLGQAYQKIKNWDLAAKHFAKVVKMNPPYEIAFNSEINRVEILSQQQQDYGKSSRILRRMLKDDKNLDYFAEIYYRLGLNELRSKNDINALMYFNQSLRNGKNARTQNTTTYLALGDYYFEHQDFERAGLYYDSANNLLDEKHPDYENIAKRSAILGDLLKYLIQIKRSDSLLRLGRDPILREKTIDNLIELEKKRALNAKNNPAPTDPGTGADPGVIPGGTGQVSSFPFYNMNSRNRGFEEFQKVWGTRVNRDYWRLNAKRGNAAAASSSGSLKDSAAEDTLPAGTPTDRKRYYKDIPLTKEAQAETEKKIEESIFKAAEVYQNSLNSPKDAIHLYEILLNRYPETKYQAQVYFEIAKLSRQINDNANYNKYKELLEQKHPESIYLRLLTDPNAKVIPDKNGPGVASQEVETIYQNMYNAYTQEKFADAIVFKLEADKKYPGNTLQSRFDYLYALCLIKNGQTEKGIGALGQVASDYAGTEIAVKAQGTIDAYEKIKHPQVKDTASADSTMQNSGLWVKWDGKEELYFILSYHRGANSNLLRAGLNDFNKTNFVFETLEVSPVRAFGEAIYLTIGNFSKPAAVQEYYKFMKSKPDFFASKGLFEYEIGWISKTNYSQLLANNRINSYVDFFKTIVN